MPSAGDASVHTEPRTFQEAVSRFELFLSRNGYSANLIWVEATDLIPAGVSLIYVKLPVPRKNPALARERFERAMKDGSGVRFATLCELGPSTCCYACVPKNSLEKEYRMIGNGLKMSAPISPVTGTPVGSRLRWWFLPVRRRQRLKFRGELCS